MIDGDPYALPEALVAAQRWDAALSAVSTGLARTPDDPRLIALLVRCLRGLHRRQEAVDAAQRLLTVSPQDPYGFRLATLVLLDMDWVDEAIGLARRAVALDPATAANHLALSRAWAASTRTEARSEQLAAAREAVQLDPHSADAQVQIGAALAADGDPRAARLAYLEALRLDPQHAAALNNLAVLDLHAGAPDAAARHLAAALAADPQGSVARRNLDAMAVRMIHRLSWWMLLAPVPAVVAAGGGYRLAARVLAAVAVLGMPLIALRWWRALTPGQRAHLAGLPERVRRRTLAWPLVAAVVGGVALVLGGIGDVAPWLLLTYLVGLGYVALVRWSTAMTGRSWRAQRAGWGERLRRWAGRRDDPPLP